MLHNATSEKTLFVQRKIYQENVYYIAENNCYFFDSELLKNLDFPNLQFPKSELKL